MEPFEKVKEYSKTVCDQIRWKKAHFVVSEEIENHIIDQRDAYILNGLDEALATDGAIAQMGDPVTIGTQLDRTHRPKPQWGMITLTVSLLIIGLFIRIFLINDADRPLLIQTRVDYAILGIGFMLIAYFTDFSLIGKYPKTVYFSVVAFSFLLVFISPLRNGKSYYAQYTALLFPLAFAAIIYALRNKGYLGIILSGIAFLAPTCVLLLVPTISGFLLFAVIGLLLLSIAIYKNWFMVKKIYGYLLVYIPTIIVLTFTVISLFASDYRLNRIQVAFDPYLDPMGKGYIGIMLRNLLDAAKLFGRGTMPKQYVGYIFPLPMLDSDFLLTYLIFNIGWIVFGVIMSTLLIFILKSFILCFRQKSGLGLFVSIAILLTFTMQVIGYVITNLGFYLFAPVSLPLISYGNTATIINLILIGIMLSVFRNGDVVKDKNVAVISKDNFITWNDGKLTITFCKTRAK